MSEGHTDGRYANHFSVGHNALEFVIEFAQFYRERADIDSHTRIVTLPQYAKALSQTLRESLDRYEQTFGPIPASNGSDTGIAANSSAAVDAVDFEQGRLAMPERPAQPDEKPPGKSWIATRQGGHPASLPRPAGTAALRDAAPRGLSHRPVLATRAPGPHAAASTSRIPTPRRRPSPATTRGSVMSSLPATRPASMANRPRSWRA